MKHAHIRMKPLRLQNFELAASFRDREKHYTERIRTIMKQRMEGKFEGKPGNGGRTADRRSCFHDFGSTCATHGTSGRYTVEGDETSIALEGYRTRQSGRDIGKKLSSGAV